MNRNPNKRLGSGKKGSEEIKEHAFFANLNWDDVIQKKVKVPKIPLKTIIKQEVPLEKVYGKGAFDDTFKNHNRLHEWSFVQQS